MFYPAPALSPDGQQLAIPIAGSSGFDLWLYDVQGGEPRGMTFEDKPTMYPPTWTPDGQEVVFGWLSSTLTGTTMAAIAARGNGSLPELGEGYGPVTFTSDGETMLYHFAARNAVSDV